ncbi:MAG: hypothetical protein M3394_09835 [Actinomycetota bacterium]|nr:hypothetical protein [Actinomycetota bacterium]
MDRRLKKLLDLLDKDDDETVGTSMRLPANLREAAALAAEMGLAASTTELTVRAMRNVLEGFTDRLVLEAHYREHPHVRPSLAEVAKMAAELEGNPLAERPDLLRRASDEVTAIRPRANADDVLLYAAGLAAGLDSAVA